MDSHLNTKEPNEQTLEQFLTRKRETTIHLTYRDKRAFLEGGEAGAKWQANKMFSNEEVISIYHVAKLFLNKNIIEDFKDLIANNILNQPFPNYSMFLEGYAKFLSRRRLNSDDTQYKFIDFLELLYNNKSFFKKLQNMSGNDSTRKNIYNFFQNIQ